MGKTLLRNDGRGVLSLRGRAFASYGRDNLAFDFIIFSLRAVGEAIALTVLPFDVESSKKGVFSPLRNRESMPCF